MAQKQQVKIESELAPEIGTIVSDQGKLRQILFNFIAWAVSRSPANDSIKVTVGLDGSSHLLITVSDHGEPVQEIAHVFDPPEANPGREANINELGIIIGRRLLDLIDGSVVLQHREPGGLETAIRIPARPLKG
jgi:K+-sensing histidine kinase KdpD